MLADNKNVPAIEFIGVSKKYRISHLTSNSIELSKREAQGEDFWALKDINLTINKGEVVGLIGANGAGKSTLLKLLSGISKPSSGIIKLRGSLGSMLEMGTGFNPDLTGRENIYINGALRGFSKAEIDRQYDLIVQQSGIEKFIGIPVKHYSSGMFVRLAFSLLAYLQSDILLLDEVNAVGDASFRDTSFGTLRQLVKSGQTVLLASHSPQDIETLCTRVVWLENGMVVQDGNTHAVLESYLTHSLNTLTSFSPAESKSAEDELSTTTIQVHTTNDHLLTDYPTYASPPQTDSAFSYINVTAVGKKNTDPIYIEDDIEVEVEYTKQSGSKTLDIIIALCSVAGSYVFSDSAVFRFQDFNHEMPKGVYKARCIIPGQLLNRGTYYINLSVCENMRQVVLEWNKAAFIKIVQNTALVKSKAMQEVYDMNEQNNALLKPHLKWELYNEQNQVVL